MMDIPQPFTNEKVTMILTMGSQVEVLGRHPSYGSMDVEGMVSRHGPFNSLVGQLVDSYC